MKWFKFHHDIPDDIRIRRFTVEEKWAWVALLCLASKSKQQGVIFADNEDLAKYCEFNSVQDFLYYLDKLIRKGMVKLEAENQLKILNWEDFEGPEPTQRTWEYRRHESAVFERDDYKCVYCGSGDRLTLDHVLPQSRGGSHEPENLVTCCAFCNSSKGARTPEEWRGGES